MNGGAQGKVSVILLAGGIGSRMQMDTPKQFLTIAGKPLACHSFDRFLLMQEIDEIIVVCAQDYQKLFVSHSKPVAFALPGDRRQDSVYNGMLAATSSHDLICIHDAARPCIDHALILRVLQAGRQYGAATVGMPVKFTIKESNQQHFVKATPDRSRLWEIQTPQVVSRPLLEEGFRHAKKHQLSVTDDVSLVELLGKEVKLVEGSHINLKVTVPADLKIAEHFLKSIEP